MSINHLFDNPLTRQRAETGAERRLLLDELQAEKRRSALLQAKVDVLVGQIAKMQQETLARPVRFPTRRHGKTADRYRLAFVDNNEQITSREIARRLNVTHHSVNQWIRLYGYDAGIVQVGVLKTGKRGRLSTLYGRTTEKPEKAS